MKAADPLPQVRHCTAIFDFFDGQNGRLKDPELARERLGRLEERNWRAASALDVRILKTRRIQWQVTSLDHLEP